MTDQNDSLTLVRQNASNKTLQTLYEQGFITHTGKEIAMDWLNPRQSWTLILSYCLKYLGLVFILAAVGYSLSHNWLTMPLKYKLINVGVLLACSLIGSILFKDYRQKIALTTTCLLVGLFIYVFNQRYPTGVNTTTLLIAWIVLMSPWVWLSRLSALWMAWFFVIEYTLYQTLYLQNINSFLCLSALILTSYVILGLREWAFQLPLYWAQSTWHRYLLLFMIGIGTVPIVTIALFKTSPIWNYTLVIALSATIFLIALFIAYLKHTKDMFSLAIIMLSICFIISIYLTKLVMVIVPNPIFQILLITFFIISIFSFDALILKRISYTRYLDEEKAYDHL